MHRFAYGSVAAVAHLGRATVFSIPTRSGVVIKGREIRGKGRYVVILWLYCLPPAGTSPCAIYLDLDLFCYGS